VREFRFRGDLYSQESTFPLVYSSNRILTSSTDVVQLVVLAVAAPLRPL